MDESSYMKKREEMVFEFHPETFDIILARYIRLVELFEVIKSKAPTNVKEEAKDDMARILLIPEIELNGLRALSLQNAHERESGSTLEH
jgi:hypothetical protein